MPPNRVAIIDYGVGNLFSVSQACTYAGLAPDITSDAERVMTADAVILPGVGAFGYAMARLETLGMVEAVTSFAQTGKPVVGICLGFQLLFDDSEEMGQTRGLGLIRGTVRPLATAVRESGYDKTVRIPNVAWLPVVPPTRFANQTPWASTLLDGVEEGAEMYFVHSFYADTPALSANIAEVDYCGFRYCCAATSANVFGCQFHPEKSGNSGLQIYRNLANMLSAI